MKCTYVSRRVFRKKKRNKYEDTVMLLLSKASAQAISRSSCRGYFVGSDEPRSNRDVTVARTVRMSPWCVLGIRYYVVCTGAVVSIVMSATRYWIQRNNQLMWAEWEMYAAAAMNHALFFSWILAWMASRQCGGLGCSSVLLCCAWCSLFCMSCGVLWCGV